MAETIEAEVAIVGAGPAGLTAARPGLLRALSKAISPLALLDLEQARARLDRMARQVPLEEPGRRRGRGAGTAGPSPTGSVPTP